MIILRILAPCIFLFLHIFLFSPVYAASTNGNFIFGTGVHLVHRIKEEQSLPPKSWEEIERELDMMRDMGIEMIRTDFAISTIEPIKGGGFHFEDYDRMVNEALERGIEVLPILDYCRSGIGSTCGSTLSTQAFRDEFSDFSYATVNHFKDRIRYWEIWNEETLNVFWNPVNPTHYAMLLNQTAQTIKRADPNAKILFGGVHALDSTMTRADTYVPTALKYTSEGVRNFDIVKIISGHQYVDRGQGIPEAFKNNIVPYQYTLADEVFKTVFTVQDTRMRYWHTESGWSTNTGTNKTSLSDQANYIVRMALLMSAHPLVDSFFQYDFRDDGTRPDKYEENLGLIKNDFTPKPSYYAYKTLTSLLKNATFSEIRLGGVGATKFHYVFTDTIANKTVHAVWTTGSDTLENIRIDAPSASKVSMLGDKVEQISTQNGVVSVLLSKSPIYLVVGGIPPTIHPSPSLTPTPSQKAGDANNDEKVNIYDYNIVIQTFHSIIDFRADFNKNNVIEIGDYNIIASHIGS